MAPRLHMCGTGVQACVQVAVAPAPLVHLHAQPHSPLPTPHRSMYVPLPHRSMYSQAALLGTTLDRLAEQFAKALGLLQRLLLTVVLLSEVALERGRALEG